MKHVDKFIDDAFCEHKYARWFFLLHRLPAVLQSDFEKWIKEYKLYCTYKGEHYRCTGASRLGDVWLTSDLTQETGYEKRVDLDDCKDWSDTPLTGDDGETDEESK